MGDISRFGVSVDDDLLKSFDRLIVGQSYATRSEALSDLMRDALVKARIDNEPTNGEVLGSLTLVYDHHAHDLADRMADIQHGRHGLVVSVLHVHISPDDCMEVIALRGLAKEVRSLADSLLSLKGVKHGKLFVTMAARQIIARRGHSAKAVRHAHHYASLKMPPRKKLRQKEG